MNVFTDTEADPAYQQFVQQIVAAGQVFALQDDLDDYAECPSEMYDDELGEAISVYCFWENETAAQVCRSEEWQDYRVVAIDLEEFMTEILMDMNEDERLVGVAFDSQLFGTEVEPIELLSDILHEIEAQGQQEVFVDFDALRAYSEAWLQQMASQRPVH